MMSIFLDCPKCGSRNIEAISPSNELRHLGHKLLGRKPYSCSECHWHGYIDQGGTTAPLDWILDALIMTIIAVLILVLLKIHLT